MPLPRRAGLVGTALALAGTAAGCGGSATAARSNAAAPDGAPALTAAAGAPTERAAAPAIRLGPHERLVVAVRAATPLRARPGGPILMRSGPATAFGSPAVLPVVRRRGGWYAVLSPALSNGRVGWVAADRRVALYVDDWDVRASLRRREVVVRRAGRVVQRFPVAIGASATPTPPGRYAVTDKLLTGGGGSPYGCCVLALSGHQTHVGQGWGGGDRLALHGTDAPGTIGRAASHGCLRASDAALRKLMGTLPLGTVVTVVR